MVLELRHLRTWKMTFREIASQSGRTGKARLPFFAKQDPPSGSRESISKRRAAHTRTHDDGIPALISELREFRYGCGHRSNERGFNRVLEMRYDAHSAAFSGAGITISFLAIDTFGRRGSGFRWAYPISALHCEIPCATAHGAP